MKSRLILMFAALFTLAVAAAVAAPANKKNINLFEATTVGSTTLKAGEYTIEWTGTGSDVQVSFSQGKNTIVTVPATLEPSPNSSQVSYTYKDESGTHSLIEIRTKNSTLHFVPPDATSGK